MRIPMTIRGCGGGVVFCEEQYSRKGAGATARYSKHRYGVPKGRTEYEQFEELTTI